jgi:hypothetical protein
MRCLRNLLCLDAAEERDPAILSRSIRRPIFITGLPRSATSFLHGLLAQDARIAVPRCWQLIYPYGSGNFGADLSKMQVNLQLRLFRFASPGLEGLHTLSADAPQECTDITAQVFQSLRFDNTHRVPSYQAWLDARGHLGGFRFHRRFLQHLDGRQPNCRWVLKSPDHVFALDAIRAIYPDAQLIFLHRDPLSVVASCCKLAELLRRPFTRHIELAEIGQQVSGRLIQSANRMVEARQSPSILHLHYRKVVEAPLDTVKAVYRHCGLTLTEQAESRMRAWAARPRRRRASAYRLATFGLDAGQLQERFADYVHAFDIAPEWQSEPEGRL